MNILVTGGAGYIGSHFAKAAEVAGHVPVVYDNFSTGHKEFVQFGPLVEGDIRDLDTLKKTLKEHKIETVVHFAAKALVGESVSQPELYFDNNVTGTKILLDAVAQSEVQKFVFSSSCAVYGVAQKDLIDEKHPFSPIHPYGETKRECEKLITRHHQTYKLKTAILRYFNVCGQDPEGEIFEKHNPETHLIPNILSALKENRVLKIFGTDYPTPDGTCIRDYVDVTDLAKVHLEAITHLEQANFHVSNVGSGRGYSIQEVLKSFHLVFGALPDLEAEPRRPGDPPKLVADSRHFESWCTLRLKSLEESMASLKAPPPNVH